MAKPTFAAVPPPRPPGMSAIGFGCGKVGSLGNPASERESDRLLSYALERGVTLFDTADCYGQGDSERAVGRLLNRRRDAAFVVTKVGRTVSPKMRVLRPFKPYLKPLLQRSSALRRLVVSRRDGAMSTDFDPGYVALAVARSLARMRFERVDALLLHGPTADELANPALGDVLLEMQRHGFVKRFGVACDDRPALEAALRLDGVSVLEVAPDLAPYACARALALYGEGREVAVLVREVVRSRAPGVSPAQAVANAAAMPGVAAVVVGTGSQVHLDELATAAGITSSR